MNKYLLAWPYRHIGYLEARYAELEWHARLQESIAQRRQEVIDDLRKQLAAARDEIYDLRGCGAWAHHVVSAAECVLAADSPVEREFAEAELGRVRRFGFLHERVLL